jgi:alkyl hydroperoxide reductase subunit AhpC
VEILSMSIDSVFVHKMWNNHELSRMVAGGVPSPMLSDTGGKVGTAFGVYSEEMGVETRGRFIIDPDGIIQGFEVLTPPVGPQRQRVFPSGTGLPGCPEQQGDGSHSVWMASRQDDPETGSRSRR